MHPAYSIIFFTVSSGAGFGLLAVLGIVAAMGMPPEGALYWVGFVLGLGLSGAGLLSSTFHLGHPERAWRAFSQWRSSWLSREGVMALLTLGLSGLFALSLLLGNEARGLGAAAAVAALITVYTTAMIYTQLKTVQRWNTPLTVLVFLGFALASGVFLYTVLTALFVQPAPGWQVISALTLFGGWGAKLLWWRHGDAAPARSTPESATGLGHLGRVRLFEAPHSGPNYLIKEMGYGVARKHRDKLRRIAISLGGMVPILAVLLASWGVLPILVLVIGLVAFALGLFTERWLFFAEAEHAVMTYYDRG